MQERRGAGIEMTSDPRFAARIRRLIAVSSVALGAICLLALATTDVGWGAVALLAVGWVTMPTVLAASLRRQRLRYLLAVPASLVSLGLLLTAVTYDGSALASLGWWLLTVGVWFGAGLGGWFWFRWLPVPDVFDHPFSAPRWSLVAFHASLIAAGGSCVVVGTVL